MDPPVSPPVDPPAPPPDPPTPTTVAVKPESATLVALEDTLDLTAEVTDQYGNAMPTATVDWIGDEAGVVTFRNIAGQSARVTATAPGTTRITAKSGADSAAAVVTVAPVPDSVEIEGDDVRALPPGASVRVSAILQDRNGHPVSGAEAVFQVEEGGGTVDAGSVVADAQGRVATTWTLGVTGEQALSITAGEASTRFSVDLCGVTALDLRLGEPRVVESPEIGCGVSVEAPEASAYYRFTLVGTLVDHGPVFPVELSVKTDGASSDARRVYAAPAGVSPAPGATTDPHPGRHERNRRMLSWIARPDGPRALPDLRGTAGLQLAEPPETRVFTRGRAGTIQDNCTVHESVTGVRLAYNDHIAIYADEALPGLSAEAARVAANFYERFGAQVIQQYFGGVGDVDGDGRILALIQDLAYNVVWLGDLLSKDDCPASNQAELMRVMYTYTLPGRFLNVTGIVVHEAKHISSDHQMVKRAKDRGQSHFAIVNPVWMEEGTAEIAREVSARLGWESIGGPRPGAMVRGSDLRRPNGLARDVWLPEVRGVKVVLEQYGQVVVSQPNSLTGHDPYGAGWGFFRFLGDWIGGAGNSRLGDAAMFARLNDAAVPAGLDGVEEVTGHSFAELMVAYAQAVSLAGTGAPEVAGVPRFSTYDMTGMNRIPFSRLLGTGRFPYPVTITGSGEHAPLWLPLAEPTTITGSMGPNGFRIHDFRAERAGDHATIWVTAPEHVRLVVTRIPDQMGRHGSE